MAQSLTNLMSTNVITVTPEQTIQEAASLMKQNDIGSIPVVENGQLVGIITDRDITLRATAEGNQTNESIRECMSTNITTASSSTDAHEAASMMAQHQIRRLPVVDNGQLVGMVALGDLALENVYQNEAGDALTNISEHTNQNRRK
ncbi:CBS domain-containing protein [Bacillus solitudinis]|uniref:CBS domain-containing protein n=1 Tax=Bacillus solitudinis TaxID=2014074 RepID=UPI000C2365C3|nr:CBS domain-containing protein [Bacillus solitudinis]